MRPHKDLKSTVRIESRLEFRRRWRSIGEFMIGWLQRNMRPVKVRPTSNFRGIDCIVASRVYEQETAQIMRSCA